MRNRRCWIGGIQERWNAGQVGCRTGGMQERRNAGKEGCKKEGMQERRDSREEGYKFGSARTLIKKDDNFNMRI